MFGRLLTMASSVRRIRPWQVHRSGRCRVDE